MECGGDGALAREERSEKVDENEEDELVLVLLGSEDRECQDVDARRHRMMEGGQDASHTHTATECSIFSSPS